MRPRPGRDRTYQDGYFFGYGHDYATALADLRVLTGPAVLLPQWALGAGCSDQHDVVRIEPDVEHWTYRDCPDGMGVELYSIEHGDHTWPGSAIDRPGTTQTIDATELALDWFAAHPAPTPS